jgi:hypothetical protein
MHLRFSTVSGNVARSTETVIMRRTADVALKVTGVRATPQVAQWDGIRVLRHVGLAMLQRLSNANTPVIVDPVERALYFLVPAGAADHWQLPDQRIADIRRHVVLPPAQQQVPPGRYWLLLPTGSGRSTSARSLRAAFEGLRRRPVCGPHPCAASTTKAWPRPRCADTGEFWGLDQESRS